jgi:photosystem II stability/assembly factor-like uncharacterized protein
MLSRKSLYPRLLGLALTLTLGVPQAVASTEVLVKLKKGQTLEQLAKAVAPMGKVERKDIQGMYRIVLRKGLPYKESIAKLAPYISVATPLGPAATIDRPVHSSVKGLEQRIAEFKKAVPKDKYGKARTHGPGYLESYKWWFHDRAYPNDTIDMGAYHRAAAHREQMPQADIGEVRDQRSINGTWQFVGPRNLDVPYRIYWGLRPVNGRINALAFNANATAIYAGAPEGGVMKTTDGGVTWTPLSDKWPFMQVSSIACDPVNPNIVYVGTGDHPGGKSPYGIGIMKSVDGGTTWTNSGFQEFHGLAISQILVDPDNPNVITVYPGRGGRRTSAIYRSTNAGQTWAKVQPSLEAIWCDAEYGIKNAQGLRPLYAVGGIWGGLLMRSVDGGANWWLLQLPTDISKNYERIELAASKTSPSHVYVMIPEDKKIWGSSDYGENWVDITGSFLHGPADDPGYNWTQGWYDAHLSVVPNGPGDRLIAGLINIQQTTDGQTWTDMGGPIWDNNNARTHSDQHSFAVNPINPNDVLFGNDGGIYRWNPTTNALSNLNRNLAVTQFYHADFHPTDPNKLLGGTQDNASPYSNGDLNNWANVGQGDGCWANINPQNPNIQYTSSQFANVKMTTNNWVNSTNITPNYAQNETRPFIGVFELCSANPRYLYGGTNYLHRYDQSTNSWSMRLGNLALATEQGSHVRSIATAPTDQNRIYVGTNDGKVYTSGNFGQTWTRIDNLGNSLPNRSWSSIRVHPTNPKSILVTCLGTGSGHVFRCDNIDAPNWVDISGSGDTALPDIPVNDLARDPNNPTTTLYVGTDVGVFMTTNGGQSWANATAPLGLPNCQVNRVKPVPGTGYLMAATFARGIWRIPLGTPAQRKVQSLVLNPSSVQGGAPFQGTVTLDGAAHPGGAVVTLADNTSAISTPPSLTIPAGATTGNFTCTTLEVGAVSVRTVSATAGGVTKSANITLNPAQGLRTLVVNPNAVVGGTTTTGTITLNAPATGTGIQVALTATSSAIQVPSTVVVGSGKTTADFVVATSMVGAVFVRQIVATYNGRSVSANLTLNPTPGLNTFTLNPNTVQGGTPTTATVTLVNNAPTGGAKVTITSGSSVIITPPDVTVPAGQKTATFTVNTAYVGSNFTRSITVSLANQSRVANLNLQVGPTLSGFGIHPSTVKGGTNVTGTVTLSRAAPAGGTAVQITYGSTAIIGPEWVVVPAGSTSRAFTIVTSPVGVTATRQVSATLGHKRTFNLTLTP